jgi:VanZ family protein
MAQTCARSCPRGNALRRRLGSIVGEWLPLVVWMAVIYWLSDQPKLPHPARKLGLSDYLFDYSSHAFTFGLLTWLAWRVLRGALSPLPWARRSWALGLAGVFAALYALLDEIHQMFVPGRWASPKDWAADMVGVALALGLLALLEIGPRRGAKG